MARDEGGTRRGADQTAEAAGNVRGAEGETDRGTRREASTIRGSSGPDTDEATGDEPAPPAEPPGLPATFTGDVRAGGPGAGADLGRGGTSTPVGDIAGGGAPGSLVDFGGGTVTDRDAVPEGGAGAAARPVKSRGGMAKDEGIGSDKPAARSATSMAPGIPAGSGQGIDRALDQPDTDLGGGVAGDTNAVPADAEPRSEEEVRRDDKGRTTL